MGTSYSKTAEKNFILIISILFLFLTFFVVKNILFLIISSMLLAYFLTPIYNFYLGKINNQSFSSILTLVSVTILILIPIALLTYFLILNLIKLIIEYKVFIENPQILNDLVNGFLLSLTSSNILSSINFAEILNTTVLYIVQFSQRFFSSIPSMILYLLIVLFITYYLLIHNKQIFRSLNEYLPLSFKKQNEIMNNIKKNIKVLFKGYFLTGFIQTGVAMIGYIVFGVPNLLIMSFLTLIVSLVPYIGTPIIWVPLSLYLIMIGKEFSGFGLLIYGSLLISMVDNFVRPVLMSNKETISPPLVFIGFVGGMFAFGVIGIILGPLIISITSILLRYLKEAYKEKSND